MEVARAALSRGACHRAFCVAFVAALASVLLASAAPATPLARRTELLNGPPRHLAAPWWGGRYSLLDGEHVSVYVSMRYPDPEAVAEKWVSFFGALPHGNELSLVTVYVAPIDEVEQMCFNADALGCYGGNELVTVGETTAGVPATSIAAHEYGHHIAAHRQNPPWVALDWGTKRWATRMDVCRRVAAGTAFPGDESLEYTLNPSEAFAESYRVLVETDGTATGYSWPIVDDSFRPDGAALAALREDVLDPWSGSTVTTLHGRFKGSATQWARTIATPLDGDLRVKIDAPDDVSLTSADGRAVLAKGTWTSAGGKAVAYRVCGMRSLQVRVTRLTRTARFTLRISKP
jgi:hypothetical protein